MRKVINSEKAPAAVGPFSQAIETNDLVFISGQLPIDKIDGQMKVGIEQQTIMCFKNLEFICEEAGVKLTNAVKVTVLLHDIADFTQVNEIYATYFEKPFPARVAYQVANLPLGALIEIDAIIAKESEC
ncbi:Rid family detoxifying hydrolase [Mollicutes bacterium LVI A0078]|nr:Rid family detoxifying hydrolase [Mollicutes bacterium LVI A0075]WOO90219.1 Rid family detoxifying hydrolase [Mollicutes bacterium LVI A0078]